MEGRGRVREKHRRERDTSIGYLLHTPQPGPGMKFATQVYNLDQNQTRDPANILSTELNLHEPKMSPFNDKTITVVSSHSCLFNHAYSRVFFS